MTKILTIFLSLIIPKTTFAHVGYILNKEEIKHSSGLDTKFFLQPLTEPKYLGLIILTIVICLIVYSYLSKASWFLKIVGKINREAKNYTDIYGWMMRLSLGIALIGAGTSNVLISPVQNSGHLMSNLEIFIGFLLLSGLFTGFATVFAICIFVVGLFSNFYIFGNIEFLALSLGLLAIGETRPGLDHLLEIKFFPWLKNLQKFFPIILRVGVGLAMSFLAIYEKILNPHMSEIIVYSEHLNTAIPVSAQMWIFSAGIIELIVGMSLIFGFKPRLISAIAFIILSTSFFYFNEAVYSHITLFGALSIIFCTNGKKLDA